MTKKPTTTSLIDLVAVGLKPNATTVLKQAADRGLIAPRDIAGIIPARVGRNSEALKKVVASIRACLQVLGVVVVTAELNERLAGSKRQKAAATVPATTKKEEPRQPKTKIRPERDEDEEDESEGADYYEKDLLSIYMKQVHPYKRLTDEEVEALSLRARNGDVDARNKLIAHNLRLAVKSAYGYAGVGRQMGLDILDVIQEGNLGLLRAAEQFDNRLGRFSTYAHWWIRQGILRSFANNGRLVRVPAHKNTWWHRIEKMIRRFVVQFGREPRAEEIAAALEISVSKVQQALDEIRFTPGWLYSLIELDGWPKNEFEESEEEGRNLHGAIADTLHLQPDQLVQAKEELKQACHRLRLILGVAKLSSLTPRDIDIFKARYGLDGSFQVKTLEAVAERYKITRERIRQIVDNKVWPKLRELGVKQDDEWFREELRRIRLLENLVGETAKL